MKTLASTIIAVLLWSCGDDSVSPRQPIPQDPPRCLSCEYVPPEDTYVPTEPKPHMSLTPSDLAFYFTLADNPPYPPQYATLTNLTKQDVDVLDIRIEDDESFTIGAEDGSACFTMTEIELPKTLADGEQLKIEVWFSFTMETHVALLIVETSFDNPDPLIIELYGKVFNLGY